MPKIEVIRTERAGPGKRDWDTARRLPLHRAERRTCYDGGRRMRAVARSNGRSPDSVPSPPDSNQRGGRARKKKGKGRG